MADDNSRGPSESSDRVVNLAIEEIVKYDKEAYVRRLMCAAR